MSSDTSPTQTTPETQTTPPGSNDSAATSVAQVSREMSDAELMRMSRIRWALTGGLRLAYRFWTRIAVRLFPEDSRQEALANQIGVPLPDRLNMSWITPQLAVGGRVKSADIKRLAQAGVTRVVDTRSEHMDDARSLAAEGIELLYIPTPDTYPLTLADLRRGASWVNEQIGSGQRVLIHCEHGVGRSVMLTAAALIADGMTVAAAIELIQRQRWQAAPNHRQIRRLQEFAQSLRERPL